MTFRLQLQIWVILILVLGEPLGAQGSSPGEAGIWSKEATVLSPNPETRKIQIAAPDKSTVAIIDGIRLLVEKNGSRLSGTENEFVQTLAELSWSPDSAAFFVTASDGGSVGTWGVKVYLIEDATVRRINATLETVQQFKKRYKCKEPEEPNVAAISWWKGSKNLLLVAEVPPHSSCPEMGSLTGYIVSVPSGKIVQELSREELRANWSRYLGQRLSNR